MVYEGKERREDYSVRRKEAKEQEIFQQERERSLKREKTMVNLKISSFISY
jgi:hypothetical protein